MRRILLTIGAAALCTSALVGAERTPVTITGCVNVGTDSDTYVLTNVMEVENGVSRVPANVYWLASTDGVKSHVGHQVEVRGTYSLDRDEGKTAKVKVETDTKTGEGKIKLENGAKKAEAQIPLPVGTSGKTEITKPYRRVEVTTVKMISSSCEAR